MNFVPQALLLLAAASSASSVAAQQTARFELEMPARDSVWSVQGELSGTLTLIGDTLILEIGEGLLMNGSRTRGEIILGGLLAALGSEQLDSLWATGPGPDRAFLGNVFLQRYEPIPINGGTLRMVREGPDAFAPHRLVIAFIELDGDVLVEATPWMTEKTIGELLAGGGG